MKIALIHFRVGETDGVSLEMDKWKIALEHLGHEVIFIAGSSGKCKAAIIPELHYLSAENDKIFKNAYQQLDELKNEGQLLNEIKRQADNVEQNFIQAIREHQIEVVVPNNIFSLGWNLPVALGLYQAIEATGVRCICHHHDFYWERVAYSNPTQKDVSDLLDHYFPPKGEAYRHVVINHIAKEELLARKGIESVVVPNVFNFDQPLWEIDGYNSDLKKETGIPENGLTILQATRVVRRKGIELAIDFVSKIQHYLKKYPATRKFNSANLVIAGQVEDVTYFNELKAYALEKQVTLIDISARIKHERGQEDSKKQYALWDAYAHADLITYPSYLEGWGNQFIEGLFSKTPQIVFEYPVFKTDIASFNFKFISLGDQLIENSDFGFEIPYFRLNKAVDKALFCLCNPEQSRKNMDDNFVIAKQHLSMEALEVYLNQIFDE